MMYNLKPWLLILKRLLSKEPLMIQTCAQIRYPLDWIYPHLRYQAGNISSCPEKCVALSINTTFICDVILMFYLYFSVIGRTCLRRWILTSKRSWFDQCRKEENQHHSHHWGRSSSTQIQNAHWWVTTATLYFINNLIFYTVARLEKTQTPLAQTTDDPFLLPPSTHLFTALQNLTSN